MNEVARALESDIDPDIASTPGWFEHIRQAVDLNDLKEVPTVNGLADKPRDKRKVRISSVRWVGEYHGWPTEVVFRSMMQEHVQHFHWPSISCRVGGLIAILVA